MLIKIKARVVYQISDVSTCLPRHPYLPFPRATSRDRFFDTPRIVKIAVPRIPRLSPFPKPLVLHPDAVIFQNLLQTFHPVLKREQLRFRGRERGDRDGRSRRREANRAVRP